MNRHITQAFNDFNEFLSGSRAPALISHSLAAVVAQDHQTVARAVADWAAAHPDPDPLSALLAARNKVFDIFFYRIVRFRRIYDFFDGFEEAMVETVPAFDQPQVRRLLAENPWREIRPIGSFRDAREFALDRRRRVEVKQDVFNDDLYRNATHQILSVDKRYTFEDTQVASLVGHYQKRVAGLFDDFVHLIQDPQQKREILLANAADKDAVYQSKSRFEIENYITNLMEFVIAFMNDEFFEHGVQLLGVIRQIHDDFGLDTHNLHWKRFKDQGTRLSRTKLAEYSTVKTRALLLRSLLPMFEVWDPPPLLEVGLSGEDRRDRKFALTLLEAYGREIYELVVNRMTGSTTKMAWYEVRNIAYLLGRIVTGNEKLRERAVAGLAPHLGPEQPRQLSLQVVSALGYIGTEQAVSVLVTKLKRFAASLRQPEAAEVCHKILSTLLGLGTPRAVEAAFEVCQAHGLIPQYRDEFARVTLPQAIRTRLVAEVRREVRKLKLTHSVFGNAASARTLLMALGHAGDPEVEELCREIRTSFPDRHMLAVECAKLLSTPQPNPPFASDRLLHVMLAKKDLPQALCHAHETSVSARLEVETSDGTHCSVALWQGQVIAASVPSHTLEDERAFYWTFLLEARDITAVRLIPVEKIPCAMTVKAPTPDLLRDAVYQRAEVQRITDGAISPDSRFSRRDVHPIFRDFSRLDNPDKYECVWEALSEERDLKELRAITRLSRHDVFKILLYFHRRSMLVTDAGRHDTKAATVSDALSTVALYLEGIRERPVCFRTYTAAANGCAYLERHVADSAMKDAARSLNGYLLDAFNSHRAFIDENVDVCWQTIQLMSHYHMTRSAAARQVLVDFVGFAFSAVSATESHARVVSRSLLEQLENIESGNDPFDTFEGTYDDRAVDELVEAIGPTLSASGVSVEALAADAEPTAAEAKIVLHLFGCIASAHAGPLKDFARELARARATEQSVRAAWLPVIERSVRLLARVATATGYKKLEAITGRLERALVVDEFAPGSELPRSLCELALAECQRLAQMVPYAFAPTLSDEQFAHRKSALVARFLVRQIDGVTSREFNQLLMAGLTTCEEIMELGPDDIAVATGMEQELADVVFLKFFHYQDLQTRAEGPQKEAKFMTMFDIGLNILKETHVKVERMAIDERAGRDVDQERRKELIANRQRTLASLFALLCLKQRYDMIEAIQLAAYEERIRLLDGYFASLVAAMTASRTNSGAAA